MLKGSLDDFSLPDIFRLVSFAHRTGRLEVVRRAGSGEIFFRDGQVYFARSSLSREPLGQKLVRAGLLTEGQLNKALDVHAQTGERVGDVLVSSGLVDAEQIESAVRQQIEDAAFDLLRWDLGEFTWEADATMAVEVPIAVSVENLIVEASRRLDELEVIKRKIPSPQAVLRMASTPPEGAAEINITPDEWRALVLVDGARTVAEIGANIGLGELDAMKLLHGLAAAGLVELHPEAGSRQDERSGRREGDGEPERPQGGAETAEAGEWPEGGAESALETGEVEPPAPLEPEPVGARATPSQPEADHVLAPDAPKPPGTAGDEVVSGGTAGDEVVSGPEPEGLGETRDAARRQTAVLSPLEVADEPAPPGEGMEPFLVDFLKEQGEPGAADESLELAPGNGEDGRVEREAGPDAAHGDTGGTPPATPSAAPLPPPHAAPSSPRASAWEATQVDRAAVVRELAGLFDEDPPRPRPAPPRDAPAQPEDADQRKRVEDDDQVTKGLVSRLIKGVKGL